MNRRHMRLGLGAVLYSAIAIAAWPQASPDFSGLWKQDNDRCLPKRTGDVTLRIDHRDPELTVETSIARDSMSPRHALQKFTTNGTASVSTGTDGDEFHTAVSWKDSTLVFAIEEHEGGRILRATESWSLLEHGTLLERIRERPNRERQVLFYQRQQRAPN